MRALPILSVLAALAAGCASYRVTPVQTADGEWAGARGGEGYVIYEPEPFLQVTVAPGAAGAVTVTSQVVYLPNKRRPYRVSTDNWFASSDVELTYENGWMLTGVKSKIDTTEFLSSVKAAIEKREGFTGTRDGEYPLTPGIYLYSLADLTGSGVRGAAIQKPVWKAHLKVAADDAAGGTR